MAFCMCLLTSFIFGWLAALGAAFQMGYLSVDLEYGTAAHMAASVGQHPTLSIYHTIGA